MGELGYFARDVTAANAIAIGANQPGNKLLILRECGAEAKKSP
jgi:hypothetical protein